MATNLLGDLLFRIIGDKSSFDKTLAASEESAKNTGKNITGNLTSQFKEIDSVLGGLGSKIGKLLTNPLILAATAVLAVGKAFVDTTKDLADYGDKISDMSDQTGISTTALQEYKFAAEQTGTTLESITSSIKLMTRGLDTNAETFKSLGVNVKDANGNFRDQNDIFSDTITALGSMTNETEQSKLALQLFGRGAQEIVPIIKLGANGLQELKDKAHGLGIVLSEETIKKSGEFKDTTEALKSAWKSYTMSLTQDSIPALQTISGWLVKIIENMNEQHRITTLQDIYQAYKNGKASVIEYHDALVGLIAVNQAAIDSDSKTAAQKKLAKQYMAEQTAELQKAEPEYKKAIAFQNALNAANSSAAKYLSDKKDAQDKLNEAADAQIEARKAALKAYEEELAANKRYLETGLIPESEAVKANTEATKKYAQALIDAGYSANENSIGGKALAKALKDLGQQTQETEQQTVDYQERTTQIATSDALIRMASIAKENEAMGKVADNYVSLTEKLKTKSATVYDAITAEKAEAVAEIETSDASVAAKQQALDALNIYYTALKDKTAADEFAANMKRALDLTNSSFKSIFESIGTDLANGELSWESFGTAAIHAIGKIVSALGDQLAAKAAATLIEAIAASTNVLTVATAPGLYASAAVLGGGAAAAWATGAALQAVSLASGGVASSPTLAMIGDNSKYNEVVAPLSPETFEGIGSGIVSALASISRPAGVTEKSVAAANGSSVTTSGSSKSLSMAGAIIIADDSGLRNLERTLRRYGLQEDVRVGA